MKKLCLFIFYTVIIFSSFGQNSLKERLEQHVYTLAADSLYGRESGSEYTQMAAEYIIKQWEEIGIEPYTENTYLQPFSDGKYQNLIGIIYGNDSELKNEYIIVGAHYDHIGYKDKDGEIIIYNGADDNASGVSTLIELGRELKKDQSKLKRSVILIAFDAEEVGLVGSTYYTNHPTVPLENIKLMFSIDMVGWYGTSGEIKYMGTSTIQDGKELILNKQNISKNLNVTTKRFETSIFSATDTYPFAKKGIPTLAVTTGLKSPYHKPEDEAHLIDYNGMTLITEHLKDIIETVSTDEHYKASGKLAKKHKSISLFTFGTSINIGSNHHYYTEGAVDGKSAISFGAGLLTQVNFGIFAIRPEVHYDLIRAKHPEGTINANNITVPLSLVLQTPNNSMAGMDIFLGVYYSYCFYGEQKSRETNFNTIYNRNEGGLTWGFGLYMLPVKIGFTSRIELSNFNRHPNSDNAYLRNRTNYFTLTYIF